MSVKTTSSQRVRLARARSVCAADTADGHDIGSERSSCPPPKGASVSITGSDGHIVRLIYGAVLKSHSRLVILIKINDAELDVRNRCFCDP